MINDEAQITEENFLQEFKDNYCYIEKIIKLNKYSITWNELLKILDDHVAQGLLEKPPIEGNIKSKGKLIYFACTFNNLELAKWLIANGASTNTYVAGSKNTLLHLAAQSDYIELAHLLVENGADIDGVNFQGNTPLCLAARNGNLKCIKYLVECRSFIDIKNKEGNALLHLAVESSNSKCVSFFIKKDYRSIYLINLQKEIPLHLAARNGNLECMKLVATNHLDLLMEIEPNINYQNVERDTALHIAAENGYFECIKYLLEKHKVNTGIVNKNKKTALHLAIENWHYDCAEFLIKNMPQSEVSKKNKEGKTALHLAILSDTNIWVQKGELLMLLLDKSDDPTINAVYDSAKIFNDKIVAKAFQNYFLKQKENMKKNSTKLGKRESWSRDFILYVSNISAVMISVLILVKEMPLCITGTSPTCIVTVITKALSLLTIFIMIYACQRHSKLDRFNDTINDYKTKIDETANLIKRKVKENDDFKVEAQCSYGSKSLQKAELSACKLSSFHQLSTSSTSRSHLKLSKSLPSGLNSLPS